MLGVSLWMILAASPAGYVPARPRPWLDPAIAADAPRREAFEFDPMFDHDRTRPPYALRIFKEHPELAQHPERLPPKLLLGDLLFHAPGLLGEGASFFGMSCASCHPNGSASHDIWVGNQSGRPGTIDLLSDYFSPLSDDGIRDPRRVPSLRGARYTAPYGHAGSVSSLGEFVDHVVSTEMAQKPIPREWRDALVLYVEQFDFLPDPYLDDLGHLNAKAPAAARLGEALFRQARPQFDGLSCAACHVPESLFTDRKTHALNHGLDDAAGEGFDTPSLLNLDERAPYFFDASAASIPAAVDQIDHKHQLGLSAKERADLSAYLDAVGATSEAAAVPATAGRITHALAYLHLVDAASPWEEPELWPLCLRTVDHLLRGALRESGAADQAALGPAIGAFRTFVQARADHRPSAKDRADLARAAQRIAAALGPRPPVLEPARYSVPEPRGGAK